MAVAILLFDAALAAHSTATPVAVGWTPAATVGVVQTLLGTGAAGIGLRLLANHLLSLRKIAEIRSARIDERSDAYTAKLTLRVTELEEEIVRIRSDHSREITEERRSCDEKLDEMRGEVRDMQRRVDQMMRTIVQMQTSQARTMEVSPEIQRALDTLDKLP